MTIEREKDGVHNSANIAKYVDGGGGSEHDYCSDKKFYVTKRHHVEVFV